MLEPRLDVVGVLFEPAARVAALRSCGLRAIAGGNRAEEGRDGGRLGRVPFRQRAGEPRFHGGVCQFGPPGGIQGRRLARRGLGMKRR